MNSKNHFCWKKLPNNRWFYRKLGKSFFVEISKKTRGCFPSGSILLSRDHGPIKIEDACVGDFVACTSHNGRIQFTPIVMNALREPKVSTEMIEIVCESGARLFCTKEHYIPIVDGEKWKFLFAEDLTVGCTVLVEQAMQLQKSTVTQINIVIKQGLFGPVTLKETVLVDGLLVSCYGSCSSVGLASKMFLPVRLAYRITKGKCFSKKLRFGMHYYPKFLSDIYDKISD